MKSSNIESIKSSHCWKIIVVDDKEQVHAVTRLALQNFQYKHKSLELISAYSSSEGQQLLEQNPDTAVLLLDIVMEREEAGLDLVKYTREKLHNRFIRIILRTGQPWIAPEQSIIEEYDINGYILKTELTQHKLFCFLLTAIRNYHNLLTVEEARQHISAQNKALENSNLILEKKVQEYTQILQKQTLALVENNKKLELEVQAKLHAQQNLEIINEKLFEANKKLSLLANQDALTGLANRRYFDVYLQQVWESAQENKHPLSILICDIDFFKGYNDSYGHQEGDHCLQRVSQIIHRVAGKSEGFAARFGGEEFAMVLPNTNLIDSQTIAGKLRSEIHNARLPHRASTVSEYVTVSIGVTSIQFQSDGSINDLIHRADQALYEAKKLGRNQFVTLH